jgi:hypothetical protein
MMFSLVFSFWMLNKSREPLIYNTVLIMMVWWLCGDGEGNGDGYSNGTDFDDWSMHIVTWL